MEIFSAFPIDAASTTVHYDYESDSDLEDYDDLTETVLALSSETPEVQSTPNVETGALTISESNEAASTGQLDLPVQSAHNGEHIGRVIVLKNTAFST